MLLIEGFKTLRNVKQELIASDCGAHFRTIKGDLIIASTTCKYTTTISAKAKNQPSINAGMIIKIGCVQTIWQKFETPQREPAGKITAWTRDFDVLGEYDVFESIPSSAHFLSFRPFIVFYIKTFLTRAEEDGIFWQLEGVEI